MSVDDPISALRRDLEAALAVVMPQIQGLQHLERLPLPADLLAGIQAADVLRSRRRSVIQNVLDALAALLADGYPSLPPIPAPPSLLEELLAEIAVLEAAKGIFATAETGSFNPQRSTDE